VKARVKVKAAKWPQSAHQNRKNPNKNTTFHSGLFIVKTLSAEFCKSVTRLEKFFDRLQMQASN
jgi:hypothetical protein